MGIRAEQFIDALDSMVYAYDISDVLLEWQRRAKFSVVENGEDLPLKIDITDAPEPAGFIYEICVSVFGDYEDTPRTGWIDDVDGFCEFIDVITYTALQMSATANYDVEDDIDE